MIELFRTILEVAKSLIGISDKLREADHQQRHDMAALFDNISSCLGVVSSEIRMGKIPHGKCGELETYAQELPGKIRDQIGDTKAKELGALLHSAHKVEGAAMDISDVADKEPYLKEIEEASGKFLALANLMRASQ